MKSRGCCGVDYFFFEGPFTHWSEVNKIVNAKPRKLHWLESFILFFKKPKVKVERMSGITHTYKELFFEVILLDRTEKTKQ